MSDEEALKKKLQNRPGHRLVIRNTLSKARELLSETTYGSVPPTAVKLKLETIRNTLEKKQSVIASLDEEIEDLCDEKDVQKSWKGANLKRN